MEITIPYYEDVSRISNSSISLFKDSPRRLRNYLDGKESFKSTSSMELGTLIHSYVLEKDKFKDEYVVLTFETPSSSQQKQFCLDYISDTSNKAVLKAATAFKNNYSTKGQSEENIAAKGLEMALKLKQYIKFLRLQESGAKKPITWPQLSAAKQLEASIKLHKKANWLLYKSSEDPDLVTQSEMHINWDISINGIKIELKSLIDRFIVDHKNKHVILCDLKTTSSIKDFRKSFDLYDYGRQLSFYWMALYWYFENVLKLDIEEYTHETVIVAVEPSSAMVKVFEIPDSLILEKLTELKHILTEICWHMNENLWEFNKSYYDGDGSEPLPPN